MPSKHIKQNGKVVGTVYTPPAPQEDSKQDDYSKGLLYPSEAKSPPNQPSPTTHTTEWLWLDEALATALAAAYTKGKVATERERISTATEPERKKVRAAILENLNRLVVEARIDELESMWFNGKGQGFVTSLGDGSLKTLDERLAQLKATKREG